jgi:thiol-disulfide isomerase/thioredoxin
MNRQWAYVIAIVLGLGIGAWALTRYGNRSLPAEVGNDVPNFTAVNLKTGSPMTFGKNYQGQVVLVNIWATWCIPCRQEMPAMERLYRELGPKGFKIAAISVDEGDTKDVLQFADDFKLTFDILHDGDGSVRQVFQTFMYPESFLVDKNGVIVKKAIGEHPWSSEANRRLVAELLGVTLPPGPAPAVQPTASPGG